MFVCNNQKLELSKAAKEKFMNHQSIKWGDFLYLSDGEKSELERRQIQYIEASLLDSESLYKHDKEKLVEVLEKII
jgi:hypothetical protein